MNTSKPRGLNVPKIENELRQLWKDLAAAQSDGEEPALVRSCVLNLLVYSSGGDVIDLSAGLAEVTSEHPSRLLLLLVSNQSGSQMTARVTAQCHRFGKGRQVCCEQIWIEAGPGQVSHLASAVSPLLVADLPVVLWWRDQPRLDESFGDLLEVCDRVIVDSAKFEDRSQGLPGLKTIADQWPRKPFSDLAWGRLNSWRRQVAAFFDLERFLEHLERLDTIEILGVEDGDDAPAVWSLLILGWLASRLGWSFDDGLSATSRGSWSTRFESSKRHIKARLASSGERELIRLSGGAGRDVFEVRLEDGRLISEVKLGGKKIHRQVTQHEQLNEFQLVACELEIMESDRVYQQALEMAARLIE